MESSQRSMQNERYLKLYRKKRLYTQELFSEAQLSDSIPMYACIHAWLVSGTGWNNKLLLHK